ncbi:MAG TPA: hypothetical protein VGH73_23190 [Thermoanaerobaculia bacterium]
MFEILPSRAAGSAASSLPDQNDKAKEKASYDKGAAGVPSRDERIFRISLPFPAKNDAQTLTLVRR